MNFNLNSGYGSALAANLPLTTGKIFLVGDSSSKNLDMIKEIFVPDPDGKVRFHATIDAAVGSCTGNAADIILVMPGHAETISSAGALALDVAGVTVIGIGTGTDVPSITIDTAATANIAVSAANITVKNINVIAGFADIATAFEVTTAKNFTFDGSFVSEPTADENFLVGIRTSTVDNDSDGLTIKNCEYITVDIANTNMALLRGDLDGLGLKDNYIQMGVNSGEAVIKCATGKDITGCRVLRNNVYRLNISGDLFIDNDTTANTGIVAFNNIRHADTAGEILVDADGVGQFENRSTATNTASGYVLPAIDS